MKNKKHQVPEKSDFSENQPAIVTTEENPSPRMR